MEHQVKRKKKERKKRRKKSDKHSIILAEESANIKKENSRCEKRKETVGAWGWGREEVNA